MMLRKHLIIFVSICMFFGAYALADKGDLTASGIYIDSPDSLTPSTVYDFEFRVKFMSSESNEWLYGLTVTFPPAYTSITPTDPDNVNESGSWGHSVSGSQVTFAFNHSQSETAGDLHNGGEMVFEISARTDSTPTNSFACTISGDMGGSLARTRYVGAPEIVSMTPGNRRVADREADFEIEFSTAIDTGSFDYDISPDPGGVSTSWNDDNTIATISHDELNRNRSFTLDITNAEDPEGLTINPTQAIFYTKGTTYESSYSAFPPVCDGYIVPGEWDAVEEVYEIGVDGKEVYLYLLNSVERLYIGIDVPADTTLDMNDQMYMYFDENNDGQYPAEDDQPSEEGIYWSIYFDESANINYRGIFGDYFGDGIDFSDDTGASRGVETGIGFNVNEGHMQYEFCPSFADSFFNPTPGGQFGMLLTVSHFEEYAAPNPYHQGEFIGLGQTPSAVFSGNPETFRTVQLAEAPAPQIDSIEPNQGQTNLTTEVQINGLYFTESAQAFIGEYELVSPVVEGASSITGLVRSSLPYGCYDVIVRNPDMQEGVLEEGFAVCDHEGNCPECGTGDDDDDDDDNDDNDDGDDDDDDDDDSCGC